MSGPKISEYELEQRRRQRLNAALEIRKAAYCDAISTRQSLLRQIQVNEKIFNSKRKRSESEKTGNEQINSAYRRQTKEIEAVLDAFKAIMNESIPGMDEITESESTQCVQADNINRRTAELKKIFNRLLEDYDREEKKIGEEIKAEYIKEYEYIKAKAELEVQRTKSRQAIQQFADKLKKTINSLESVSEVENAVSKIKSVRVALLDNADKLLHLQVPSQTKDVKNLIIKTVQESEALINRADKEIQGPLRQIKNFAESKKEVSRILDDFDAQQERAALSKALTEIDDTRFTEYKEPEYYKALEEDARKELDSILDRIEDAVCDDSVCQEDAQRLEEIYINIQETAEHSKGSLAAEIIQAKDSLAQVNLRAKDFEQCYCRYFTACEMLNQLYEANGEGYKKIKVMERMDHVSFETLCDEEERINGILTLENERCFIRKTINEVMQEFGYSMGEEFVLHREQKGTHLLCKEENGDTAIHVHFGNGAKKRIMLEVVGVGKTSGDNLNDGVNGQIIEADKLSEKRRQELFERQTAFCQIHPEIIKALEAKGIRTSSIELNPPGIEFCEEIAIKDKTVENEDATQIGDDRRNQRRRRETPKFMEMRMSKRRFS